MSDDVRATVTTDWHPLPLRNQEGKQLFCAVVTEDDLFNGLGLRIGDEVFSETPGEWHHKVAEVIAMDFGPPVIVHVRRRDGEMQSFPLGELRKLI